MSMNVATRGRTGTTSVKNRTTTIATSDPTTSTRPWRIGGFAACLGSGSRAARTARADALRAAASSRASWSTSKKDLGRPVASASAARYGPASASPSLEPLRVPQRELQAIRERLRRQTCLLPRLEDPGRDGDAAVRPLRHGPRAAYRRDRIERRFSILIRPIAQAVAVAVAAGEALLGVGAGDHEADLRHGRLLQHPAELVQRRPPDDQHQRGDHHRVDLRGEDRGVADLEDRRGVDQHDVGALSGLREDVAHRLGAKELRGVRGQRPGGEHVEAALPLRLLAPPGGDHRAEGATLILGRR